MTTNAWVWPALSRYVPPAAQLPAVAHDTTVPLPNSPAVERCRTLSCVLAAPVLTADYSQRYVLIAVSPACVAAGLAFTRPPSGAGCQPLTSRIRLVPTSAITRLPFASVATPSGALSPALVAGPPSPEYPSVPLPATVYTSPAVIAWS